MAVANNTVYVGVHRLQDLPAPNMIFAAQQQQVLVPGYHPSHRLPGEVTGQYPNICTVNVHNQIPYQTTSGEQGDTSHTNHTPSSRTPTSWIAKKQEDLLAMFRKLLSNRRTDSYNAEKSVLSVNSLTVTNPMATVADPDQQDLSDLQLDLFDRAPEILDTTGLEEQAATATSPTSPGHAVEMLKLVQMEVGQELRPCTMRQPSTSSVTPQPTELETPSLPAEQLPIQISAEKPAKPECELTTSVDIHPPSDQDEEQPTSLVAADLQLEKTRDTAAILPTLNLMPTHTKQKSQPYPDRHTQPTVVIVEQPPILILQEAQPIAPDGDPPASPNRQPPSNLHRDQSTSPASDDAQSTGKALQTQDTPNITLVPVTPEDTGMVAVLTSGHSSTVLMETTDTNQTIQPSEMNAQPEAVIVEQLVIASKDEQYTNPEGLQSVNPYSPSSGSLDGPPPTGSAPTSPLPSGPPPSPPPPSLPPHTPLPTTPPPVIPDRGLPTNPEIQKLDNTEGTSPVTSHKCKEEVDIERLTEDDIEICQNIDTTEADKLMETGRANSPESPCCDTVFTSCKCLKGGFSRFLSGEDQSLKFTPLLKMAAKKGFAFFIRYISPLQKRYFFLTLGYKLLTLLILVVMFVTSLVRLSNRIHQSKSYGYDVGIAMVSMVASLLDLFDIIQSIATYRHKVRVSVIDLFNWCKRRCSNNSEELMKAEEVEASESEPEQQLADESHSNASRWWQYLSKYSELIILIVTEVLLYTNIILTLFAFICDEAFKSIGENAESFLETLNTWIAFIFGVYIFRPILLGFNVMVVREAIERQNNQLAKLGNQRNFPSWVGKIFNFQVWLVIHITGQSVFHAFLLICIGWKIAQENCHLPQSAQSIMELSCTRPQHFSFFTFYNVLFGIAAPWLSFVAFLLANVSWSKEFYIKLYLDCLLKSAAIQSATRKEIQSAALSWGRSFLKQKLGKSEATEKCKEENEEKVPECLKPAAKYIKQLQDGRRVNHTVCRQLNLFAKTQEHFVQYASQNALVKALHAVVFGPTVLFCTSYFVVFFLHIIFLGCRVDEAGQNICAQFEFSVFKGTVTADTSDYTALVFLSFGFFGITNLQSFAIGIAYTIVIAVTIYTVLLIVAVALLCVCFAGTASNHTNNRRRT